jgi:hypothetical protein
MKATAKTCVQLRLRPRLTAVAVTTADVVRAAGGWLFDQALAGWDVTVLTAQPADPRPLEILGAQSHSLDAVCCVPLQLGACLRVIAVPATLYDADERVRRIARNALETGPAELLLWGDLDRAARSDGGTTVRYQPSLAAHAFKAQALAAMDSGGETPPDVEVFLSLGTPVLVAW